MSKPLIAWRLWSRHVLIRYDEDQKQTDRTLLLKSVTYPVSWEGPVLRADTPPKRDNHHGIHAVKFPQFFLDPFYVGMGWQHAFGEVELYGKIVEHEMGYRAQTAIIRSLYVPVTQEGMIMQSPSLGKDLAWVLEELEQRYQVVPQVARLPKKWHYYSQLRSHMWSTIMDLAAQEREG